MQVSVSPRVRKTLKPTAADTHTGYQNLSACPLKLRESGNHLPHSGCGTCRDCVILSAMRYGDLLIPSGWVSAIEPPLEHIEHLKDRGVGQCLLLGIDPLDWNAQLLHAICELARKSLVNLPQIHILLLQPGAFQQLRNSHD